MKSTPLSSPEMWDLLERSRLAEWQAMQSELEAFRASDEERSVKILEKAALEATIEETKNMLADRAQLWVWAERLAQAGREGVRFDRWQQGKHQ